MKIEKNNILNNIKVKTGIKTPITDEIEISDSSLGPQSLYFN